jgi:hypothetical protein
MNLPLAAHSSGDPSYLSYPVTLPIEIALKDHTVQDICAIYGLTAADWRTLCQNPIFVSDLRHAIEELKKDGVKFKLKARLQAELMLKRIWDMAHEKYDVVPPAVQADLLKFVVRAAGYDGSRDQVAGGQTNALQININLV